MAHQHIPSSHTWTSPWEEFWLQCSVTLESSTDAVIDASVECLGVLSYNLVLNLLLVKGWGNEPSQYVKVGTIFGRSRRGRSWTGRVEGPGMMWNHFQSLDGNPLQYSCLENPRDREAWWAAIYRVAQSQTRLKWLSSSSSVTFML